MIRTRLAIRRAPGASVGITVTVRFTHTESSVRGLSTTKAVRFRVAAFAYADGSARDLTFERVAPTGAKRGCGSTQKVLYVV
jgi:hypothetical protein